jgi:hypothetical protein
MVPKKPGKSDVLNLGDQVTTRGLCSVEVSPCAGKNESGIHSPLSDLCASGVSVGFLHVGSWSHGPVVPRLLHVHSAKDDLGSQFILLFSGVLLAAAAGQVFLEFRCGGDHPYRS